MKRSKRNKHTYKIAVILFVILLFSIAAALLFDKVTVYLKEQYRDQVIPRPYSEIIDPLSLEYKVPRSVIYSIIKCESNFDENAVSKAGAVGLMQIMPDTFSWLNKLSKSNYTPEQITDPKANIHLGIYYLSWLYDRFNDWELVYAAYNAGHNRVKNWLENPDYSENGVLVDIPIKETKHYVSKVKNYREEYTKFYPELN